MAKIRKIITAGCLVVEAVYPKKERADSDRERAAKSKASSEAQRRMNQIYSYQKFELILAANFPTAGSGLVVTLTYDDEHLPRSRTEAQRRFKYFLAKLRRARREAGLPEPLVAAAPEVLTSASGRWHHHCVIDNTGQDIDMLRACWIYGSDIDVVKLRVDKEKNHETLAKYMTKELRECQDAVSRPGLHGWSVTRNCKRPEVETMRADSDDDVQPPESAEILLDERRETEFYSWRVVKYRLPASLFPTPPRAVRRRS